MGASPGLHSSASTIPAVPAARLRSIAWVADLDVFKLLRTGRLLLLIALLWRLVPLSRRILTPMTGIESRNAPSGQKPCKFLKTLHGGLHSFSFKTNGRVGCSRPSN